LPLFERARVEVYLPDLPSPEYEALLKLFASEFTSAFGGCSTVRGIEGSYLSEAGVPIGDKINLIYSDTPLMLSTDSNRVAAYVTEVKRAAMGALVEEEEILVSVEQVYHAG
jgi:hypothetical protein